jgi:cytochrome P450
VTLSLEQIPISDVDLFSDEHLEDPYPDYKAIRDAGPLVYMSKFDVHALARYKPVRQAVDNWQTFRSGQGVSLNDLLNKAWTGTVIGTDPPYHGKLRGVLNERLSPRQVRKMTDDIDSRVAPIVEKVVQAKTFDAMGDVAYQVVPNFVVDVVGFPPKGSGSEHLVDWAEQIFNVNGPDDNKRMQESVPGLEKMFEWLATVATKENVDPKGFAHAIHQAAANGDILPESVVPLMAGYSIPGTDTTLGIIGNAIALFAQHPDQWDLVRQNPDELMRPALVEVLRMDAPVQWFARVLSEDWVTEGMKIPAGSRVMLLFGSANRDERHYPDPDRFDVTRDPMDHVSFGGGVHGCPGQHLAQLQTNRLLRAFIDRGVKRFEITGQSERSLNNTTRNFKKLPITVITD